MQSVGLTLVDEFEIRVEFPERPQVSFDKHCDADGWSRRVVCVGWDYVVGDRSQFRHVPIAI
jgi:hypothetical protein